jgi:hypothetical protein
VTIAARPVVDAVLAALVANLPGSYSVTEAEGDGHVPAVVVYVDPGLVGGYPYTPGNKLNQTVSLKGIGMSAAQAMNAATAARDVLLSGVVAVSGRRVLITPDDTQQPYPYRDDSLTPPLFTQLVILNVRN